MYLKIPPSRKKILLFSIMGCSCSSKVFPMIQEVSEYHKSIARKNWSNIVETKNIVNFFDNIFNELNTKYPNIVNNFISLKDKAELFGQIILMTLNNFDTLYDKIKSSKVVNELCKKNYKLFYYIVECFISALRSQNISEEDILSWKVIMDLVVGIIIFYHHQ